MEDELETGVAPIGPIPGVRANPDGSIARNVQPAEVQAQTEAPELGGRPQLNIDPVIFDKPEMDAFTRMFQTASGGPSAVIAREVAGQVAIGKRRVFLLREPSRWNGAPV
jgi:hypothetical protein